MLPGVALAALALLLISGLEKEHRAEGGADGALIKDRWRLRMTSAQVAEEVSAEGYIQRLREYHARHVLDSDAYMTELVGSVAEPLIVAAKGLYPQTTDWAWEWHLADTGEINAYCMPGGRIIVLSGLLSDQMLGDDRDIRIDQRFQSAQAVGDVFQCHGLKFSPPPHGRLEGCQRRFDRLASLRKAVTRP